MYYHSFPQQDDRFFPWGPFLLGGLGGAALIGATRPRPYYMPYTPMRPMPYYGYY